MTFSLRPYQHQLVADIRAAYREGHRSVLAVAPTGAGKTVIFAHIAREAAARGNRVAMVMHRHQLIMQTSRALGATRHGIIRSGTRPSFAPRLQVASVSTLVNRLDQYKFDLVVFDEAHHCTASSYRRIADAYPQAHILGVTATPCRTDGTGLRNAGFQVMVLGPTTAELTAAGHLSRAEVYAPGVVDTSGVHSRAGDFARGELAVAVDRPQVTGDAVKHYRQYADMQPAIAFCVSVQHAEHVAESFRMSGYAAQAIHGKHSDQDRAQLIGALASGELHVLTSCDLISEGVDVPVVSCGIMLRPTQSRGLAIQQMGRVLRPAPGKTHAVILDHAGNCLRHGLPTTPQDWSLDGEKRTAKLDAERPQPVRQCEACYFVHVPAPTCPQCGYEYPPQPREVEQVDGDLAKLEEAQERIEARRERGQARTLEELTALGKARGYKPGWARYVYNARRRTAV